MSKQPLLQLVHRIVSACDIVDVVSEHVALKRRGRNFLGLCPFHKEKTPSFNVSQERQIYKCFGCGVGGDAIKFVQNFHNVDFREAITILGRRVGIDVEHELGRSGPIQAGGSTISRSDLYKVNTWAAKTYASILWDPTAGATGRKYLLGRGLTEASCRTFQLGFAPAGGMTLLEQAGRAGFRPPVLQAAGLAMNRRGSLGDLFSDRVIFPIVDATGNVIAFGGRTLGDDQPKYLNTPETAIFHKGRGVFGLHAARSAIQQTGRVVVMEGYTDVIGCAQSGLTEVVATLGTSLTEDHVNLLRRYAEEVILVFDGDGAGERAAKRALTVFLTQGVDVRVASLPSGKDPFDMAVGGGAAELRAIVDSADLALDYTWKQVRRRYGEAANSSQRRAAIDELLTTVAACDPSGQVDAIQQSMVLSRLSGLLSVPVNELTKELQKFRRRPVMRAASGPELSAPAEVIYEMPVTTTAYESACRELIEVLLCEPGYVGSVRESLSPQDLQPPVLSDIGRFLWQAYDAYGEFTISELIAGVESVSLASVMTELHRRGSDRGNFAQTVEQAMLCFDELRRERSAGELTAELRSSKSNDDDEIDRQLQALQQHLQNVPRRTPGALME